jgi:hypothetical protein
MALIPKEPQYDDSRQARAEYLEYAQIVIGEPSVDYPTIYGRFAENEWACIELDKAVALEALGTGRLPVEIASLLHQGPYIQVQVHHNRLPVAPMTYYARGIVLEQMLNAKMLLMNRKVAVGMGFLPEPSPN